MSMTTEYAAVEPTLAEVSGSPGLLLLEFGAPWCGVCRGTQPAIAAALATHPEVRHLKIEDASGRPLGRSFRVKLWPTLVLLRDGTEIGRLVRPPDRGTIGQLLDEAGGPPLAEA
jgi:thioredoxin 1